MSTLERLTAGLLLAIAILVGVWFGIHHYGAQQYSAGQAAAIAAGRQQLDRETATNHKTESDLRAKLAAADVTAHQKELDHAASLEAAQRRVRVGTDRLRCPVGAISTTAPAGDRSTAGGPAADGPGPAIVPEAAADLLGIAADVAGLVRRYERLEQRFEDCRAVNGK